VVIFLTITFPTASIGACKVLLKFLKAFTDKPPNKTSEWPEKNVKTNDFCLSNRIQWEYHGNIHLKNPMLHVSNGFCCHFEITFSFRTKSDDISAMSCYSGSRVTAVRLPTYIYIYMYMYMYMYMYIYNMYIYTHINICIRTLQHIPQQHLVRIQKKHNMIQEDNTTRSKCIRTHKVYQYWSMYVSLIISCISIYNIYEMFKKMLHFKVERLLNMWCSIYFRMIVYVYPLVICYIAIENGHRNSEFSHEKWWFSIAFC